MEIPYATSVRADTGINNTLLGVWLFLASEAMLFGGLISGYAFLRTGPAAEQFGLHLADIPLAAANTLVLLASSLSMTLSVWALRDRAFKRHRFLLGTAIFLGSLFFGIKCLDYSQKLSAGFYPSTTTYLSVFFTLTGIHGLHVLGGVIVNGYLWLTGPRVWIGQPEHHLSRVTAALLYWNFVDVVWIILFLLLYVV
jgi:cytochrome c oxidase subunit III